ncbi:MAG TPA: AAA family ATPase, partial [Pirellulales bacterium]
SSAQEEEIVMKTTGRTPDLPRGTLDRAAFLALRDVVYAAPVAPSVASRAVGLCRSSRPEEKQATAFVRQYVAWGAGPRGSQNLVLAAKARALLDGRAAPTTTDVMAVATPILRHRVLPNHRALSDGVTADKIVAQLLSETAV